MTKEDKEEQTKKFIQQSEDRIKEWQWLQETFPCCNKTSEMLYYECD